MAAAGPDPFIRSHLIAIARLILTPTLPELLSDP